MISKKYMNGERYDLNIMIIILKSIIIRNILGLEENFQGTYFDHAFSKVYYHATTHEFFLKRLEICIHQGYIK
jgi:hypothetical protein